MKHLLPITQTPVVASTTTLAVKLDGIIQILDRIALAQLQSPWKAPGTGDGNDDNSTDTNTNTTL